jgi:agmatinase
LHTSNKTEKTIETLELVVRELLKSRKTPVILGGEHTITFGAARGLKEKATNMTLISFDAHLDLRDEYAETKLSHTTFMRRINEELELSQIIEVGTRAVCKEELEYAKKTGIEIFTSHQIKKDGAEKTSEKLKERLKDCKNVYVSIDMDILDPAFAPAVQNPEPDGLETSSLLEILQNICDERILGFDVVEIAPNYDFGNSAIQAAKITLEFLGYIRKTKERGQ